MLEFFRRLWGAPTIVADPPDERSDPISDDGGLFSTHFSRRSEGHIALLRSVVARAFQKPQPYTGTSGMDDASVGTGLKSSFAVNQANITDTQLAFFASNSFIGYQLMAILAQHWLISKCCSQPAKDAIRNGFKLTANNGVEVAPDVLAYIEQRDKHYNLTKNLLDFVYYGRVFGIRIAMFDIVSSDPDYYEKPFNPDGITPGSYRGITQIDPYWITPELDGKAASDPSYRHFYEPTFWQVNGKRIHRSHLVIFRGPEVPDLLKPTYLYGGLSVTQMIFERVYAAERTANEAPMLAQCKRETVIHVDMDKAVANQKLFEEKLAVWTELRNNWGVKAVGTDEVIEQFETSLADLDTVIMTQYQLVASVAGVPVTKLLGTVPKGFNSTGEYDESSYHEELESIQAHDLSRLLERHHLCVMRSDVAKKYPNQARFDIVAAWNPLDALTAEEQATVNKTKAETGKILVESGAIDGEDERNRLINDPESGYNGMAAAEPELVENDDEAANP